MYNTCKRYFSSNIDAKLYISLKNINSHDLQHIKKFINNIDYNDKNDSIKLKIIRPSSRTELKKINMNFNSYEDINVIIDKYIYKYKTM